MANGDIDNSDVQAFVELATLATGRDTEIDDICTSINSDVNLILKNLGISLPVTDSDSVGWLKLTKQFGAASLTMELLAGQDTEEENTRAQRFWDRYQARLMELINSGGQNLEADFQTDPVPLSIPQPLSQFDSEVRKRFLRFPQRAAADQFTDQKQIARTRADWKKAIGGL